jgi:hypothetical protein
MVAPVIRKEEAIPVLGFRATRLGVRGLAFGPGAYARSRSFCKHDAVLDVYDEVQVDE